MPEAAALKAPGHDREHVANRTPSVSGPASLTALQRALGNRAFTSMLQRDLAGPVTEEETSEAESSEDGGSSSSSVAAPHGGKDAKGAKGKGAVPEAATGRAWKAKDIEAWKTKKKPGVEILVSLSKRDTVNGIRLVKGAGDWDRVISSLPEGANVPSTTRKAIITLLEVKAITVDDAKALFLKRFKHGMGETGGTWKLEVIAGVWKQLELLPESDVSENTILTTFRAMGGGGGFGPSWEAVDTINTIDLGEDMSEAGLSHTVRHEVGHAVHGQIPGPINKWLQDDMGMWFGGLDDNGVNELVTAFGGYPAKFTAPDGTEQPWTDNCKGWIRHVISSWTGNASWSPTRGTPEEGQDAWVTAYWDAMPQKLKEAIAQSPAYWYTNYQNFVKAPDGNHYFLNHWYHRWFKMSPKAKAVIDATGENYTAMSEKEFFANAYAEYFADPKGKKDPKKWGGKLPKDVQDFFLTCIVKRNPYNDFTKSQRKGNTNKGTK